MRGLLKFILLAFSFCLNLSAIDLNSLSNEDFSLVRYSEYAPSGFSKVSGVEILNSQYLKIGDDYYTYTASSIVFNLSFLRDSGFLAKKHSGKIIELVNYDSSFDKIKIPCQKSGDIILACSRKYKPEIPGYIEQEFSYYEKYFVAKVASCQPDEHFNTFTKQCQKCGIM